MIFDPLDNGMEQWRTGIFIALTLHITVLILAIFGPDLILSHKKSQEIYTVKLFEPTMVHNRTTGPSNRTASKSAPVTKRPTPLPHHTAQAKKSSKPPRPVHVNQPRISKPAPTKKVVSKPSIQPAVAQKKKAVSLNPEKKKLVKKTKTEEKPKPSLSAKPHKKRVQKKQKGPSAEELLQKRLAAIKQEVKEKQEERHLQERLKALSQKLRKKQDKTGQASKAEFTGIAASMTGKGKSIKEITDMYGEEVSTRIKRRWNFPTEIIVSKGLEAIIEIEIADDGTILSRKFEKTSGNMLFDQSAMRAVKDTTTVPALPPQLRPGPLVMGIRFRPEDM